MELGNGNINQLVNKNKQNKNFINNYKIFSNSENDSHAIIATQVKKNSVVLDVGCAQGVIGKYLKEECNCKVFGIDLDSKALEIANKYNCYEKLYNFSISDKNDVKYQQFFKSKIKYDYIIFADLLEHLIDPASIIYEFQKLLSPNGKILISIPNISHFDIIHALLNDEFNYKELGLLDNTHLRFFTKNSFIDMINEMNEFYGTKFSVKLIKATTCEAEYINNYPNVYSILNKKKDINVLQNIFELSFNSKNVTKKSNIDLCNVLEQEYKKLIDDNNLLIDENKRLNKLYGELEIERNNILESKIILDSEKAEILKRCAELEVDNEKLNENNKKLIDENKNKENELRQVSGTLQGIYDSRTWRTIGKIKRILKIFWRR